MTTTDLLNRIKGYPKGFQFTLPYNKMSEKTRTSAYRLMEMAVKEGLVKSVSIGAGWNKDGKFDMYQNETFERL